MIRKTLTILALLIFGAFWILACALSGAYDGLDRVLTSIVDEATR